MGHFRRVQEMRRVPIRKRRGGFEFLPGALRVPGIALHAVHQRQRPNTIQHPAADAQQPLAVGYLVLRHRRSKGLVGRLLDLRVDPRGQTPAAHRRANASNVADTAITRGCSGRRVARILSTGGTAGLTAAVGLLPNRRQQRQDEPHANPPTQPQQPSRAASRASHPLGVHRDFLSMPHSEETSGPSAHIALQIFSFSLDKLASTPHLRVRRRPGIVRAGSSKRGGTGRTDFHSVLLSTDRLSTGRSDMFGSLR